MKIRAKQVAILEDVTLSISYKTAKLKRGQVVLLPLDKANDLIRSEVATPAIKTPKIIQAIPLKE